jgi:hypothetical protein
MARILTTVLAWRLRKMLAGFVLLSATIGILAMGATVALSLPTWMTLAAYPATCSLTLVMFAAIWSIRSTAEAPRSHLHRRHLHG